MRALVVGPLGANCYVVSRGQAAAVVDPGGDAEIVIAAVEETGRALTHIVNTHGHADHMEANAALKERFPDALLCIHPADAEMLTTPTGNLSLLLGRAFTSPPPDRELDAGDVLDPFGLEVLHTPGHTAGSISLYAPGSAPPLVFTGDALFAGGIGRTDFPGGDHAVLLRSIRERLLALPPKTRVLPGHGPESTVGTEARSNPFL